MTFIHVNKQNLHKGISIVNETYVRKIYLEILGAQWNTFWINNENQTNVTRKGSLPKRLLNQQGHANF